MIDHYHKILINGSIGFVFMTAGMSGFGEDGCISTSVLNVLHNSKHNTSS